ncbi:MAG TPA: alpha/beta hydrolase domain-containing protein, partial [Chloroflexota bacterium]|nr:alpha/beta hydrolase domain-containing protein [Chloroflexota bacterium]
WQWDVVRRTGYIGLEAPQALDDSGRPIQGTIVVQFQPSEPYRFQKLAHWPIHPPPGNPEFQHRPYPAADLKDPDATLTVRESNDAPHTLIPRSRWRFAREENGAVIPDDSHVWFADGFQPGLIYEVSYRTRICPVAGTGLLAVRDQVSFLRYAKEGNPSAGRISRALGFGASQCGRFLREFVYQGLNLDEQGRRVFDGIFVHVAGARRGEFNHRYAQPSVQHQPGFGHLPPFADDEQTDPLTGETDGLLRRQRELGGVPRLFHVNTSSEYWRSDCSLIHTDPAGTRDLEPPEESRIYLLAGTQHGPGGPALSRETPSGARVANPLNTVNQLPLMRALLIALEEWVADGKEPPPSRFPRLADETAVPRPDVLEAFARIPGASLLATDLLPTLRRVDVGPNAAEGIGQFPATLGEPYPSSVSAVDPDRNEVAGIRMPGLQVPLGSHTGWNPRDPATGGAGQLLDMQGSTLLLPRTQSEREATGDPRRSIAERYASREDYLARIRAASERLVADRYLVEEDVELIARLAGERYDAFTG